MSLISQFLAFAAILILLIVLGRWVTRQVQTIGQPSLVVVANRSL